MRVVGTSVNQVLEKLTKKALQADRSDQAV